MNTLELFFDRKSKGHFTLEDINILNDQLMHYYYVEGDREIITKEDEIKEFDNYIQSCKERNEVFDSVKDHLLYFLNEYMEKETVEQNSFTYYTQSVAEMEGHNNEDVFELAEKLKELSNDEIIQVLTSLMKARDFFELFLVSDTMRELKRYKQRAEVFEHGYKVYKNGYEAISELTSKENINKMAETINKEVETTINLIKNSYVDTIIGKQTVKN